MGTMKMKKTTGERVESSGGGGDMCEIVKRKKKGRPSKADLARRRLGSAAPEQETERRRSLRRRNVRYNFDVDDYLDEDFEGEEEKEEEEEEEEEERRREKKVKLVMKLDQAEQTPPSSSAARGRHAVDDEEEEDDGDDEEEGESERRKVKKRRIISGAAGGDEDDELNDNDEDDGDEDCDMEGRGRKGDSKGRDSGPGTPWEPPSPLPMPSEKKRIELILDKLQKKDTYGVYAEPVDPEELPDYHDVIDNPMDFQTVRSKLANGSYSTVDQFESDVFLICSNAMQYNTPDTVYYKQARTIQEMAKKKFQKLRIYIVRTEKERLERPEKENKSEAKTKPSFLPKKPAKKNLYRTPQELAASDFSPGVSLPAAVDMHNTSLVLQANGCEKAGNSDICLETTSMIDFNLERAEELSSGKGILCKSGKRSLILDENRRGTYNISNQPAVRSESVFTTFEGEAKQLITVGLHAEYFYARSLSRFAATLGPIAWKIASQRIEQALPVGCKYGRGWVSECEPLSAPILMPENIQLKEPDLLSKLRQTALLKNDATHNTSVPPVGHQHGGLVTEKKTLPFCSLGGAPSEGKFSSLSSSGAKASNNVNVSSQQQITAPRKSNESEKRVKKPVELNLPPTACQNGADHKQNSKKSEAAAPGPRNMQTRNSSVVQPMPSKQPPNENGVCNGSLPSGKGSISSSHNRVITSSSDSAPHQMAKAVNYFPHGHGHGGQRLDDPVELMKMAAEKTQKKQNSSNQNQSRNDATQAMQSAKQDDANNATAAAARAWMSIGAGGFKPTTENSGTLNSQIPGGAFYNPAREFHPQMSHIRAGFPFPAGIQFQVQSEKNGHHPFQAFVPQPVHTVNDAQLQSRHMAFPQFVGADMSRYHIQLPWRGLSPQGQPKQKQDTRPPDLNIGFQSPSSPAKQSSTVMVDSQQPDLALQL